MKFLRRAFLVIALVMGIGVGYFSIVEIQSNSNTAWATLAASLAVVTSVVSAWETQRIVDMEETKLLPHLQLAFDAHSRRGLMLLRLLNDGGSIARNVSVKWEEPLVNAKSEVVDFTTQAGEEVGSLPPGASVSRTVDGHIQLFAMEKVHRYKGEMRYQDAVGRKYAQKFWLDAEIYRGAPLNDSEDSLTHGELQKLPREISNLKTSLERFGDWYRNQAETEKET